MAHYFSSCPSADQLHAFSLGKLSEAEAEAIARHLESCPACLAVAQQEAGDSFTGQLKAARGPGSANVPPDPKVPLGQTRNPKKTLADDIPPGLEGHAKFRFVRRLGEGGMGAVYLAEHLIMAKQVAIKVVSQTLVDNPEALERFHREIRAAARLDHPNIIRALDAESVGSLCLLVMEYVDGQTLDKLVASKGPLPVVTACRCVKQAAQGLQHAHEKGMIHRDIKPQNLIVTRQGLVKILDFGLARLVREQTGGKGRTQVGAFLGTPEYVAPEQAADAREADIRADIYSLGCTLYYLLSGRAPFEEPTPVKVVLAHLDKEAKPLHEVRSDLPEGLSAMVAKMMAKDPGARFQNPGDVAQALAPFCKSAGVEERKPKPVERRAQTILPGDQNLLAALTDGPEMGLAEIGDDGKKGNRQGRAGIFGGKGAWWRGLSGLVAVGLAGILGVGLTIFFVIRTVEKPNGEPPDPTFPSEPQPGQVWTNRMGMKFAWIPAGNFRMGSPPSEKNRNNNETQHRVTLTKGFYLGVHEVTQAFWQAVMGNNPSIFKGDNLPVEQVSWEDCQGFCQKLSAREGMHYRLPTEAEWEYACRAGSSDTYAFGGDEGQLGEYGWYSQNSDNRAHFVGMKKPNRWGLFDMYGNVFEWCQDGYGDKTGPDQVDPQGPSGSSQRVFRGGGWISDPQHCRSAWRYGHRPGHSVFDLGFRLTLDLPGKGEEKSPLLAETKDQPTASVLPTNPQPGQVWTNRLGMKFAWIPGGSFLMGSPPSEKNRNSNETPHRVNLTMGFYLGLYEVTQSQWQAVMGNNPSYFKGDNLPVEQVSWEDCQAYCQKLSVREGKRYRLPTEAEWEYACRAGSTTIYYFGEEESQLGEYGWYRGNSGLKTNPVGIKKPNRWGLYDMAGNVWESCQDGYGNYPGSDQVDPGGLPQAAERVVRGGGWSGDSDRCRSAARGKNPPSGRSGNLGCRLALIPSG